MEGVPWAQNVKSQEAVNVTLSFEVPTIHINDCMQHYMLILSRVRVVTLD